jgi:hypothetical protein
MKEYLINRILADAANVLRRGQLEASIQHPGMRGRFRELLVGGLLDPWLPPYVACGSGMIIDTHDQKRQFTQDDIILFDRSLTPPILAAQTLSSEGVFLYNSVLARIEVKSKVTRGDLEQFVRSSIEIASLKHGVQPGFAGPAFFGAFNMLVAFDADAEGAGDPDYHLKRLLEVMRDNRLDPLSGIVSMLCIAPYGFWKIGTSTGSPAWERLHPAEPERNLAWFLGCVSNSCYLEHAKRQGRDPVQSLEGGVGMYFPHPFIAAQT